MTHRLMFSVVLTLALCVATLVPPVQAAPSAQEAQAMSRAMDEVRRKDWSAAKSAARGAGQVGIDVVEWHRLRAGDGSFDETIDFLNRNPDWPGLPLLRRRSDGAVPFGDRWEEVLDFYDDHPPQTGAGSSAQIAAFIAAGRMSDAEAQAILAWLSQSLSRKDEEFLLSRFDSTLNAYDEERLDMLLWRGLDGEAERMFPRVSSGQQALARARLALSNDKPGVDTLIEAVPDALQESPGLAYERFQWRIRKGRNQDAIDLIAGREGTLDALGQPARWASWRRYMARWAMRNDQHQNAYRVASQHGLVQGSNYADLEWLSGYLSLRFLNEPERALRHFENFHLAVRTPISLGRAGYWEGRAWEAMGNPEEAAKAYAFGARYQTSFYGQLAAERAGIPMDPHMVGNQDYGSWEESTFADSTVLEAGLLLQQAGERSLSERFLTHLTESLNEQEVGQLADLALSLEEPHIALMIAKRAASAGIVVERAYYPVVDLGASNPKVPRELALAIARRESEFDPVVVSGANAMGLMQLVPATAREMSQDLGIPFDRARLLSDPVYNATLGQAYLAELMGIYGQNPILISATYNAGLGRTPRWINEFGDPRTSNVNAVDWIEHIPFRETRNYVMRVSESLAVYRARLSGQVQPLTLRQEIGRP